MSAVVEQQRVPGEEEGSAMRGYLHGSVSPRLGVLDAVAGAEIFAVIAGKEPTGDVRRISERELRSVLDGERKVFHAVVGERGAFRFDVEGERGLEALDVYAAVDRVPMPTHPLQQMPLPQREHLYLGRREPAPSKRGPFLSVVIPQSLWCLLKRLADAWTVSGRVTACADDQVAIPGVMVSAFDVDLVQHDGLGSAVTTPSGTYRIDYPGSAYRRGTILDVELHGGPDLYFSITDSAADVLAAEEPSVGRSPGRAGSGPCAEVDLCVDVPVPGSTTIPTLWTGVGAQFVLTDYNAEGYALPGNYAMTGSPKLRGSAPPKTLAGHPVEYRFLVSDVTTPNGAAPPAEASFTRIVGVGANQAIFVDTHVGTMVRVSPVLKQVKVWATLADLDAEGWLDVNKSIERAFVDDLDVDPIDIPMFLWDDEDALMAVNIGSLTTEPDVPSSAAVAGQPVPAVNHIDIEKKAFRFEIREVVDKPNGVFNVLPGNGQMLNAMVVSSNAPFLRLAMKEHQDTTLCSPLTGQIHVAHTVYHPHLRSASISIASNNGTYTVGSLVDPPLPLVDNTSPAVTSLNDPGAAVPNSGSQVLHRCTYIVTLTVGPRLHDGTTPASWPPVQTSFFYEP